MTISSLTNWFRAICPELAQKQLRQEGHATFASFYAMSLGEQLFWSMLIGRPSWVPVHIRKRALKEAVDCNPCLRTLTVFKPQ